MQYRSKKLLALPVIAAFAITACGSDEEAASTTAASETTTASAGSLAGICPETIAIQLDWMPEAEHGFLYHLVGDGWTTDNDKAYVTGPLVAGGVVFARHISAKSVRFANRKWCACFPLVCAVCWISALTQLPHEFNICVECVWLSCDCPGGDSQPASCRLCSLACLRACRVESGTFHMRLS